MCIDRCHQLASYSWTVQISMNFVQSNEDCVLHIFERIENIFDFYMFALCSKTHLRCAHSVFRRKVKSVNIEQLINGKINGYVMKDVVVFIENFLWHFGEYIEILNGVPWRIYGIGSMKKWQSSMLCIFFAII